MPTMTEVPRCEAFSVWGGTAVVAVTEPDALTEAREAVDETLAGFDLACSPFREDSELTALNNADGEPLGVSRLLLDAVAEALRAARLTDGDVDPTIGQALVHLASERALSVLAPVPGWRVVSIDERAQTLRLPPGVRLDLGATAKALAADRAAADAHRLVGCGVLVSLGGDIATAGPAPRVGWRIRVTDDHRADERAPGQTITIRGGGLATSSTTVRRWTVGGAQAHHLIDPATSRPVRGRRWRTASVAARTCLDANIASTATLVRGRAAVPWLQSLALPSRLVGADGCVVHLAGWPVDGDDLR